MQIALANPMHISEVVTFFNKNLDCNNNAVYSEEFLCPLGIKAAIKRKQMIVATVEGQVVGAFRFYRKKTQNTMLKTINDLPIIAFCPTFSEFNDYFHKTDWELQQQSEMFNVWVYNV